MYRLAQNLASKQNRYYHLVNNLAIGRQAGMLRLRLPGHQMSVLGGKPFWQSPDFFHGAFNTSSRVNGQHQKIADRMVWRGLTARSCIETRMRVTDKKAIEETIEGFISQPSIREALARLADALPEDAVVYLVGGALRNLTIGVFHGQCPSIDDVDLFIGGVADNMHLSELMPDAALTHTDLGGVRWNPQGSPCPIDICLLKDFIIIKKYGLAPHLDNLLGTLDFTMNAMAYDIRERRLHQRNAFVHIRSRTMEFNTRKLYTKTTIAYRTLLLRHKTNFILSHDVFDFMKQEVDLETLTEVKQILRARFGKRKGRIILRDYDRICSFGSFEDYTRYAIDPIEE
jgi:hypothetical protein